MKKLSGKLTMQLQASTNYKIFADKKKLSLHHNLIIKSAILIRYRSRTADFNQIVCTSGSVPYIILSLDDYGLKFSETYNLV